MLAPWTFDQTFRPYLQELARFETTKDLEESTIYGKLRTGIEGVLDHVWHEELAIKSSDTDHAGASRHHSSVRRRIHRPAAEINVIAWNIERGLRVDAITRLLQEHSSLRAADLL